MPPQQAYGLLDFIDKLYDFGAHCFSILIQVLALNRGRHPLPSTRLIEPGLVPFCGVWQEPTQRPLPF
jgi:hypothetical protein